MNFIRLLSIFVFIYPYTSATGHARAMINVGYQICAIWHWWRSLDLSLFSFWFQTPGHDARNGIPVVSFLTASPPKEAFIPKTKFWLMYHNWKYSITELFVPGHEVRNYIIKSKTNSLSNVCFDSGINNRVWHSHILITVCSDISFIWPL